MKDNTKIILGIIGGLLGVGLVAVGVYASKKNEENDLGPNYLSSGDLAPRKDTITAGGGKKHSKSRKSIIKNTKKTKKHNKSKM